MSSHNSSPEKQNNLPSPKSKGYSGSTSIPEPSFEEPYKVFIGGLPPRINEETLRSHFGTIGQIDDNHVEFCCYLFLSENTLKSQFTINKISEIIFTKF